MTTGPRSTLHRPLRALVMFALLITLATAPAPSQTFSVLYEFTGGPDGSDPIGVTVGPSGVLYGSAVFGGAHSAGTIFKLNHIKSSWIFSPLYEFTGGGDGLQPSGGVTIGPNGALYGTTVFGGTDSFGVVFELRPPPAVCKSVLCYWNETVLHSFTGAPDGEYPTWVNLVFDHAGNIYGTTFDGGAGPAGGIVFELSPSGSGYTENILYHFSSAADGSNPSSGVVLDSAGNLYGTTTYGGTGDECEGNCGTVYQLVPSGGNWTENVLVDFHAGNGESPLFNPIVDASGNVYGTAYVAYKLTPSGGGFTYSIISSSGCQSPLVEDAAGNLYGTCENGPGSGGAGWVYELTNCSQTCTVVDLHDFNGTDGAGPFGFLSLDANGNLYGTTVAGGTGGNGCNNGGCGVVWEITPQ